MVSDGGKRSDRASADSEQLCEPVAWLVKYQDGSQEVVYSNPCNLHPDYSDIPTSVTPLYTTHQQSSTIVRTWVELTSEDYNEIFNKARTGEHAVQLAAAKLKQKNGFAEEKNT